MLVGVHMLILVKEVGTAFMILASVGCIAIEITKQELKQRKVLNKLIIINALIGFAGLAIMQYL